MLNIGGHRYNGLAGAILSILAWVNLFSQTVHARPSLLSSPKPHAIRGDPDGSNYTVQYDPFNGDADNGQPGIILETKYTDGQDHWFMVYQNSADLKPYRAMKGSPTTGIEIAANAEVFIDLASDCRSFAGRAVRGDDVNFDGKGHNLGTWAEINWVNYPRAYGDVSVIEGNDGPITYDSDDSDSQPAGFDKDIIPDTPKECMSSKDGYNEKTREYSKDELDGKKVYIVQDDPASVHSESGRVKLAFYQGYH